MRLNTYLDSIGPVWSSVRQTLNPTGPSSARIPAQRDHWRGPETHLSQPRGYPFKRKDGCPDASRGSSFWWTWPWGGCSEKYHTFRGYVGSHKAPAGCALLYFEREETGVAMRASPVSLVRFVLLGVL